MELLAREKAENLLNKDHVSRRKLRQVQVRQQSSEWMERNRKRYVEERQKQIELITQSLTQEAQEQAVRDIEILERMHDLCAAEVGAAHRAAAKLPNYDLLQAQKDQENLNRAKSRGVQALAHEKMAMFETARAAEEARLMRENIRKDEDYRLKESASRVTRSQVAINRFEKHPSKRLEKRRRPDFQPSLAKTLRVPKESHSDAKLSKSKKHTRLSRKPKDVVYYDSSIPQGTLKYPAPKGLVVKHSKSPSTSNAFEIAKRIAKEQKRQQVQQQAQDIEKAREAERRGKTALKVAKLQRQLDNIQNEFLEGGFQVDPKLNDSFLGLSDGEGEREEEEGEAGIEDVSMPSLLSRDRTTQTIGRPSPLTPKSIKQSKVKAQVDHTTQVSSDSLKTLPSPIPKSPLQQRKTPPPPIEKTPKSPKKDLTLLPKSPHKTQTAPATIKDKVTPRSAEKPPVSLITKTAPAVPKSYAPVQADQRKDGTTQPEMSKSGKEEDVVDHTKPPSGRRSPLEKSIVFVDESGSLPSPIDQTSDKPKLISTKKSLRKQQEQQAKTESKPTTATTTFETPSQDKTEGKTQGTETGKSTAGKSSKSVSKKKTTDEEEASSSSNSLHTLSTIESHEDVFAKQITDHQSPPDNSQEFPLTSTPAKDKQHVRTSRNTSLNSSALQTTGTLSPRSAKKRKKALQYYIQKLLEMRPASINNLAAISTTSVSSCIEIPTSAVNSIVSSTNSPPESSTNVTGSTTTTPSSNEGTTENGKSFRSSRMYSTTNGTSDHYSTLSSVTEEEEEETSTSRSKVSEPDLSGATTSSSGETLAKVTVALSPRSNKSERSNKST